MNVTLRPGNAKDATRCGVICYEAFRTIAEQHNFPADFPLPADATEFVTGLLAHPGFYAVVAELDGQVVGSNFLDERSAVAGIGPITVVPAFQNHTVGRQLMQHVLDRAAQRRFPGVRLVQAAYHNRSLSLYTKLGFVAREPLSTMQGAPLAIQIPGYIVRPATAHDLDACNQVCVHVHGHDRFEELLDAIQQGAAIVVEHEGRITGYATPIAFFGHAVGKTNEDLKALIGAATAFPGPGFLLPTRNGELLRWCLDHGLRVVQPMMLMSVGLYNEPAGAFLPSVIY
ncbi:MAG: GNAT family N-acetyltransferase [Candidatus Brocadia sp.]|nr:GNAT family N-acetyltransferase [Candidatus Brocadia sp.]